MTEPSTQAVCEECTTPFAPDLVKCPHCGLDNPQRAAFLAGEASAEPPAVEDPEPRAADELSTPPADDKNIDEG
jgi:hypothetical protein